MGEGSDWTLLVLQSSHVVPLSAGLPAAFSTKRIGMSFELTGICFTEKHEGPCSPTRTSQHIEWLEVP